MIEDRSITCREAGQWSRRVPWAPLPMASIALLLALFLGLVSGPEARITSVQPPPGGRLEPGQYIQLGVSPPMSIAEFNELNRLIEIRDEARGRLLFFPSGIGTAPFESIVLIPVADWTPGGYLRLEAVVDSTLDDSTALSPLHLRWPYICGDCEWIGDTDSWPIQLQGPASEAVDFLPLDLNRDNMLDLAIARREQLVFFGVDTCASNPAINGLGGLQLQDFSLERELIPCSIGTNSAGNHHPGEGILLKSGGQEENLLLLARTGADNVPTFNPLLLEEGSYAGSPKLARPLRMQGESLCQDLLVATRGGDLVQFLVETDCSGLSDSTRVLWSGLGDPLDLEVIEGTNLAEPGLRDYIMLLDVSPTPLQMLLWAGDSLAAAWTADPELVQGLTRLEAWSDGDSLALPDVVAWSPEGDLLVVANVDTQSGQAESWRFTYPEPLRDVESLPDGRLILAGFSTVVLMDDPRTGVWIPLVDPADLPGTPRRIHAFDIDSDGDNDLSLLFQDGRTVAWLDEPVGDARLESVDSLVVAGVVVGDTLERTLVFRHTGLAETMELSFPDSPADPEFPFSWVNPGVVALDPGDSLELALQVHPGQPVDSCYNNGQFHVWWSFPDCIGQTDQRQIALCLQAGDPLAEFAADSLYIGESCGGSAECADEACATNAIWLRNLGSAQLQILDLTFLDHPDPSASAPESFCQLETAFPAIDAGDSLLLELSFCPPMTDPWPWTQACMLELVTNATGADSLLVLPLGGTLTCPWPPVFTDDLPQTSEDVASWVDLEPLIQDADNTIDELTLQLLGVTGTGGLPADSVLRVPEVNGFQLRLEPALHVNSTLYPELGVMLELSDPSGNVTRDTLLCRIMAIDDPLLLLDAPPAERSLLERGELRLGFQWLEVDGDSLQRRFVISPNEDLSAPLDSLSPVDTDGRWSWTRTLASGDSLLFGGDLYWEFELQDVQGDQGFGLLQNGRVELHPFSPVLPMVEDSSLVIDLALLLLDPEQDPATWQASWVETFGASSAAADSLVQITQLADLVFRIDPSANLNQDFEPDLGLSFILEQTAGVSYLDSLWLGLQPVDDPVTMLVAPPAILALREGREASLEFLWREVDGDPLDRQFLLATDSAFVSTIEELVPQDTEGAWSYQRAIDPGDSLLYPDGLWWRLELADLQGTQGHVLELEGRLMLHSLRDTLQMVEDETLLLDLGGWLLNPGEDASAWTAGWLGLLGAGGDDPDSLMQVSELGGLLYELDPGRDVNSELHPGLGLLFELEHVDQGMRRDTLQVFLHPVDDAPRLLDRPAVGLELHEDQTSTLHWQLDEVDGHPWSGGLRLSYDPAFGELIQDFPIANQTRDLSWIHRPEVGDSLRHGGRIHWQLDVADEFPGMATLSVGGELPILQSPQDLRLLLTSTPPTEAFHGDSLELKARILSETGYVGGMQLRLERDLQEVRRMEWAWSDLPAGATLDTTMVLLMPLSGRESCWRLVLHAFNPAEDQVDNVLSSCITLSPEPVGAATAAFTPNRDGINDELLFQFGRDPARSAFHLEIYDLTGRQVLKRTLPGGTQETRWNGRLDGADLLPGVYVYVMLDGNKVLSRGQVGLVR